MAEAFLPILISGLILGALYSLIASGLSLIWSTLGAFNFAHGAFMTLGAYIMWTFTDGMGLPVAMSVVLALLVVVVIGLGFERLLIRPFISRPDGPMLVMVVTLVMVSIIENTVQMVWGPRLKQLPVITDAQVRIGDVVVQGNQLLAIVLAPLLIGALFLLLSRTRVGSMVRGVEQNRELALMMGIRPAYVYAAVVATAAVLAAVAGILMGGIQFMSPTMGSDPLIKGFMILVFGGAASLKGTLVGAYVVGFIEAASSYFMGLFWSPVILITLMFAIMLIRPEGLIKVGARR